MIIRGSLPDFSFEKKLWGSGHKFVGGADEVGRGSFAGPVVAACVVFSKQVTISTLQGLPLQGRSKVKIDDSKKLTPKQREVADKWIRQDALAFGIGEGSVGQINKLGLKKATHVAYRKAIREVNKKLKSNNQELITHLLVDAFFVPHLRNLSVGVSRKNVHNNTSKVMYGAKQTAIVKGDQISLSIAAASIIAKVYRDNLMINLSKKKGFSVYKWHKNKGYGTLEHRSAILKFGQTKHHRRDFIKTFPSKN